MAAWLTFGASLASIGLPGVAYAQEDPENLFISPCGQPFRAKSGAPYPVADWFKQADKDADGHLTRAEFNADSEAFFHVLDRGRHGVLTPPDITYYETKIAPEVLGLRVDLSQSGGARLWLAQFGGPGGPPVTSGAPPVVSGTPPQGGPNDATQGASPYSFFDEPEPVAAADVHYRGLITRADFVTLSNAHFDTLDHRQLGYLTLDTLPKTPTQRQIERLHRRRR